MPSSSTDSSSKTSKARFEFKDIDYNPNLYGQWARSGDRAVEVIMACDVEWFWFATIGDRVCRTTDLKYTSRSDAMRWARGFLCGQITPEIWPDTIVVIAAGRP